jgi:hypothetical protein
VANKPAATSRKKLCFIKVSGENWAISQSINNIECTKAPGARRLKMLRMPHANQARAVLKVRRKQGKLRIEAIIFNKMRAFR